MEATALEQKWAAEAEAEAAREAAQKAAEEAAKAEHVEQAVFGPAGMLSVARPGFVLIDSTTSEPDSTRRIGAALRETQARHALLRLRVGDGGACAPAPSQPAGAGGRGRLAGAAARAGDARWQRRPANPQSGHRVVPRAAAVGAPRAGRPARDDDRGLAELHRLGGQRHGLEAGAADLVDGHGGDAGVETGAERGLAGGVLASRYIINSNL